MTWVTAVVQVQSLSNVALGVGADQKNLKDGRGKYLGVFFFFKVYLNYNIVLFSGVEQSDIYFFR